MFRFLLAILFLIPTNGWCVTQWSKSIPAAGDSKSAWPGQVTSQWSIMETLLSNYKRNMIVTYKNTTTLTVALGECVVSNSGGSLRLMLQNSGNTDITSANLDTGASFSSSSTYYVYAGTSSGTAASASYYISLSSSAPTGVTYYLQLGSFTTDGSANVTASITNINIPNTSLGAWDSSKTTGVAYQALTDGFVLAYAGNIGNGTALTIVSDSNASPTTTRATASTGSGTTAFVTTLTVPVKKGDYWKVNSSVTSPTVLWIPLGS